MGAEIQSDVATTVPLAPPRASGETHAAAPMRGPASRWRARSRFAVHVGLLLSAAGALGTLQLLHVRIALHTDVGLVFVGLVALHLVQRRRTLLVMATRLLKRTGGRERFLGRVVSDLSLFVITANVLVSGIVDWNRGSPAHVPLPRPFARWHLDAGLLLVIYLVAHVTRRRTRLRRSSIR